GKEDRPYDRFVFEQLAGDTVGADAATGFLVAGPFDDVKSNEEKFRKIQRQEELADMINATGTAFLGLTLGCARCHNHKFDPITQQDYYSLQAVLAGVQHGERPLPIARGEERQKGAATGRESIAGLEKELEPYALRLREPVNPYQNVERFEPTRAKFVRFTVLATSDGLEPVLDELEVFGADDGLSLPNEKIFVRKVIEVPLPE